MSPNPTSGYSTVSWDATGYSLLTITNGYTGGIVAQFRVDPTAASYFANFSRFGNGPYYIRLEGDKKEPLQGQFIKTTE